MTMEKFDGAELYNNALVESRFKHKITFQKQQNTSTVTNNTKNRKKEITHHLVLMFQEILVKIL